ncbi:dipeptide epimerase [Rapidithrix thailandica]|uniref:Dipeptide epimerase n=1 Tax=Rapidithrix thailandica TaxID=413964 RepID=A0AAW9SAU7_9BACT
MLSLTYKPYNLKKKHVFRIARGARTSTPLVLTRITFEGVSGYGEASMPPLYGESVESTMAFYQQLDLSQFQNPFELETILNYVDQVAPGHPAAKAAIDIALHDLIGKLLKIPCYQYFGLPASQKAYTSKTIGIDTPDVVKERVLEAKEFQYLKIKLGSDTDKEIIQAVREVSNQALYIDANQGWTDRNKALEMIYWLQEQGTVMIEQPMPVDQVVDLAWLSEKSPLPIIGDEGVQRLPDVLKAKHIYNGVNIKLMKSTGLREAYQMIVLAKSMGLKVMLGCMSETSCAISAAAQLAHHADFVDLDGNLLVTNNPYLGVGLEQGKLQLSNTPGLGLAPVDWEAIQGE